MAYVCHLQIFAFLCQSPRDSAIKCCLQSLVVTRFMIAGGWVKRHYITVALLMERAAVLMKPGRKKGYRSQAFTSLVRLSECIMVGSSFVANTEGVLDMQLHNYRSPAEMLAFFPLRELIYFFGFEGTSSSTVA